MDPPIHTEYFLSGGATILIFMAEGSILVISFCILSAIPGYMVVPPEVTSDVNIALHDGVVSGLMDSSGLHSNEG